MAGNVTNVRFPTSATVPTYGGTFADILIDFPELAGEMRSLVSWRDIEQPDQRGTSANRMYPEHKPDPYSKYPPGTPTEVAGVTLVPVPIPGPAGPKGDTGPPGPQGVPGDQMWQGHGPPDLTQLPDAHVGDDYLDVDTGDIYQLV
jgi:hypothetical protein